MFLSLAVEIHILTSTKAVGKLGFILVIGTEGDYLYIQGIKLEYCREAFHRIVYDNLPRLRISYASNFTILLYFIFDSYISCGN